ncbi:MAG: DUF6612 family protein [Anaerolineae bacterium]
MKHLKWSLIGVLLLGLVLGSLVACGGPKETPTPEAGPPEAGPPEATLAQAQPTQPSLAQPTIPPTETPHPEVVEEATLELESLASADQLSSYRSRMVTSVEGTQSGQPVKQVLRLLAEYTREPRIEHIVIEQEGEEGGPMEVYQTADRLYMKMDGEWLSLSSDEEQSPLTEGLFTPEEMLKDTCGWKKQRDTDLNGVKVHHWTMDRNAMEKCMSAEAMSTLGSVTDAGGDLYIAVDQNYVVKLSLFFVGTDLKVTLQSSEESLDEGRLEFSFEMTDVNQPFALEIPPEALASGAMPEDVPIPDDAEEVNQVMGMITFKSARSPQEVADFYKAEMPKKGWTEASATEIESMYMLEYSQDGRTANLMISTEEENGKTSVIITISTEEE